MASSAIHSSEWEDFDAEVKRHGLTRADFDFEEKVRQMTGTDIQPIVGTVKVINRKTGKSRTYNTGHGSTWVAEATDDLDARVFG